MGKDDECRKTKPVVLDECGNKLLQQFRAITRIPSGFFKTFQGFTAIGVFLVLWLLLHHQFDFSDFKDGLQDSCILRFVWNIPALAVHVHEFLLRGITGGQETPHRRSPTLDPHPVGSMEVADGFWSAQLTSRSYCIGEFPPCFTEIAYPTMPSSFPLNVSVGREIRCKSNNGKHPSALIIVISHVEHFREREEIRRTWGSYVQNSKDVTLVFSTSKAIYPSINARILEENHEHHDVLQSDLHEIRYNVGYKELSTFQWVMENCPGVTHVLKADEDAYVVVPNLLKFIENHRQFAGVIFGSPQPFRWINVDMYDANAMLRAASGLPYDHEVERAYPLNLNPPYALSNYLITADLVGPLRHAALHGPHWAMDGDVYVSGVLRERIMAPLIERGVFRTTFFPGRLTEKWVLDRLIETGAVIIHRRAPHGKHLSIKEMRLVHSVVENFFYNHPESIIINADITH